MGSPNNSSLTVLHDRNRKEVLDALRANPGISQSALAEHVRLSRATVSGIVAELLSAGIVEKVGQGSSTGGRPPIALQVLPSSRIAVGAVLVNDRIQAAMTDMEGNLIRSLEVVVPGSTPKSMLDSMCHAVEGLLDDLERARVLGVGIGTPGIVDLPTGVLRIATSKHWIGDPVPIKEYLEARLRLPVYVANRSRVAALGELKTGMGRNVSNLVYLFLGQGIVAGIVHDRELFVGSSFSAGEIGHISVAPEGPLCNCGNRGCLEVYATEEAILAQARRAARDFPDNLLIAAVGGNLDRLTIRDVMDAARHHDEAAVTVLRWAGTKIGMAVATIINLLDPEMVVIGGPLGCLAGDTLLVPIIEEARRRASPRLFTRTEIVTGQVGMCAEAIGAAVLAVDQTPIGAILAPESIRPWERR